MSEAVEGQQQPAPTERSELLSGTDRIRRDFDDALRAEDPDATLYSVLVKRPGAVIVALSLFALFVLASTSISGLTSPEFINKAAEVPRLEPLSAELLDITLSEITASTTVQISMDYSVLGDGILASALQKLATKLQYITVKFDEPIDVRTRTSEDSDAWEHVATTHVAGPLNFTITPGAEFVLEVESRLSDIGRPDVVGLLVRRAMQNKPITLQANGTVWASKWGIQWRMPFCVVKTVTLPQQTTDELADVSKVIVTRAPTKGVDVRALANASLSAFPIGGSVPDMGWIIKIPGCQSGQLEVLCEGHNQPFDISKGDATVETWFSALIVNIPTQLSEPCDATDEDSKSPIDRWISEYLEGRLSTFYIEGDGKSDKRILNDLLTGFDIPFSIFGKPASEKLISSVTIEDVAFQRREMLGPSDDVKFSGKVLVDVTLPSFMEIDKATVIVVTGVKGTIQLFSDKNEHFAQIIAQEWLQAITLANHSGYKITCYFDDLPMRVTNTQVFARVSQEMVLAGHALVRYDAIVDVYIETPVGEFAVKKVRVKGETEMRH